VDLIKEAGVVAQSGSARIRDHETVHLETKSGSILTIVPDEKFRISCTQVGRTGVLHSSTPPRSRRRFLRRKSRLHGHSCLRRREAADGKGLIKVAASTTHSLVRGDAVLARSHCG